MKAAQSAKKLNFYFIATECIERKHNKNQNLKTCLFCLPLFSYICGVVEQRARQSIDYMVGGGVISMYAGKSGIFVSAPKQNDIESDT